MHGKGQTRSIIVNSHDQYSALETASLVHSVPETVNAIPKKKKSNSASRTHHQESTKALEEMLREEAEEKERISRRGRLAKPQRSASLDRLFQGSSREPLLSLSGRHNLVKVTVEQPWNKARHGLVPSVELIKDNVVASWRAWRSGDYHEMKELENGTLRGHQRRAKDAHVPTLTTTEGPPSIESNHHTNPSSSASRTVPFRSLWDISDEMNAEDNLKHRRHSDSTFTFQPHRERLEAASQRQGDQGTHTLHIHRPGKADNPKDSS